MIEIFNNETLATLFTWLSGITAIIVIYKLLINKYRTISIKIINNRIKFISNHCTYIKRLEYGVISILMILLLVSLIFISQFSIEKEADKEIVQNIQFFISLVMYATCLFKAINFKDLVNAKKVLKELNKQKIKIEEKLK